MDEKLYQQEQKELWSLSDPLFEKYLILNPDRNFESPSDRDRKVVSMLYLALLRVIYSIYSCFGGLFDRTD